MYLLHVIIPNVSRGIKQLNKTYAIFKFVFPRNSVKSTCLLRLYRVAILIVVMLIIIMLCLSFVFCEHIYKCCFNAGCATIPTSDQSMIHNGVGIAGWNEHISPFHEKSLFWHRLWIEADKPRHGALANIMRSTRSKYHYKIRELHQETSIR